MCNHKSMFHKILDIENLEKISFERSKFWANLINKIEERGDDDDGQDCMIGFNEDYESEDDDAPINSSNEAEEDDIFDDEDMTNGTLIAGCNEPTMLLQGGNPSDIQTLLNCEEGNAELQDLLNETVPLLQEHKRKWEEAGINRILDTFDKKKIEEKVGGWLRRNHSGINALSVSPVVAASARRRCCNPKIASSEGNVYLTAKTKETMHVMKADYHAVETDTDASLHSMDTARYIRSSRQQRHGSGSRGVGKRLGSSSSTATMTIKTFRLVQKEREALRKKYACLDSDDDGDDSHCRRGPCATPCHRYEHQQQHKNQQLAVTNNNIALREPAAAALKERRCNQRSRFKSRRKHLRKYRQASNSSTNSSSDSYFSLSCSSVDNVSKNNEDGPKNSLRRYATIKHRRRRVSRKRICCRTVCCGRGYRHSLSSSSSHSYVFAESDCKVKRLQRGINDKDTDMRPYKRESDCRCCSDIKLCRETRHLADTSTEAWVVENCDSPMKNRKLASPSCHRQQLENKESSVSALVKYYKQNKQNAYNHILAQSAKEAKIGAHVKYYEDKTDELEKKETVQRRVRPKSVRNEESNNFLPSCSLKPEPLKQIKVTKRKGRKKQTKESLNNEKSNCDEVDETFLKEIEEAIRISKETFAMEQEKHQNQNVSMNLKEEKNNRKRSLENVPIPKEISPAKTISLVNSDLITISSDSDTIQTPIKKFLMKPQPRSVKLRKLADMSAKNDDTIFQHLNKNIYNSTTLSNDTAMPRDFFKCTIPAIAATTAAIRSAKSSAKKGAAITAISTKVHSNQSSSLCSSMRLSCENNDNDCTIVSSTTGIDPQPSQPQPLSHAPQDILVYKPTAKRAAAPSSDNSFVNITQEHLCTVIGEKMTRKFLKYYMGRLRFNSNSTIYYRPPKQPTALLWNADHSTDSDDALECVCKYGDLYETENME